MLVEILMAEDVVSEGVGVVQKNGEMDMTADELRGLAADVGQIAYGVHEYFGNGLLET